MCQPIRFGPNYSIDRRLGRQCCRAYCDCGSPPCASTYCEYSQCSHGAQSIGCASQLVRPRGCAAIAPRGHARSGKCTGSSARWCCRRSSALACRLHRCGASTRTRPCTSRWYLSVSCIALVCMVCVASLWGINITYAAVHFSQQCTPQ